VIGVLNPQTIVGAAKVLGVRREQQHHHHHRQLRQALKTLLSIVQTLRQTFRRRGSPEQLALSPTLTVAGAPRGG